MMNQRICAFAVSMLVPAAIVAACAKRTVTVDVSAPPRAAAPAPPRSGGAAATESPVMPLAEVTTRPGTASPGTSSPGGPASPGTSEPRAPLGSARPAPAEFAARAELEDIHFDFDRHDIRPGEVEVEVDRKSTRLNSSHSQISYAVFCLKKKKKAAQRDSGYSTLSTCHNASS